MLLGARQFFERRGAPAGPTARDYVQNGLIAMWDGIENAGWGVHDAAATTWKDLVGSRNLTLANAAFSSTSLYRESSSAGYMAYDAGGRFSCPSGYTVEICSQLMFDGLAIIVNVMFNFDGVNQNTCFKARMRASGYGQYGVGPLLSTYKTYSPPWPRNGINGTITYMSSLDSFYNAIQMEEDSSLTFPAGNAYSSGVALGNNSVYAVYGNIYSARIYSRALTVAEIAANYAIDKVRFNLP